MPTQPAGPPSGRLRRTALSRPNYADRPIRDLQTLRGEKYRIEDDLLALVADDPAKVAAMNRLLDDLSLNSNDHTHRRLARLGDQIDALTAQAREHDAAWLWAKAPDNAVKRAVGRVRQLLYAAEHEHPPGGKTVERAVAELYAAVDRAVQARVSEAGPGADTQTKHPDC